MTKKKHPRKRKKKDLKIDFISMKSLKGTTSTERIQSLLQSVKNGHIVVLDEALSADSEAHLMTETMKGIEEDFSGIEFCSLPKKTHWLYRKVMEVVNFVKTDDAAVPGLTLVGPAEKIKEIKRDLDAFYVSAQA